MGKNMPNNHKIYQMATKYTNIFPLKDPPKWTKIGIFGLKVCNLATLVVVVIASAS
jgi:hypothetical protein